MRCCDLHNRNCEPPSELCCGECTEAHHGIHADPPNYDRVLSSHHDGSKCSNPDHYGRPAPAITIPCGVAAGGVLHDPNDEREVL